MGTGVIIYILVPLFAVIGFVGFIYATEYILQEVLPYQSYEDSLAFVLVMGIIGAVLGGWLARRIFHKRSQK